MFLFNFRKLFSIKELFTIVESLYIFIYLVNQKYKAIQPVLKQIINIEWDLNNDMVYLYGMYLYYGDRYFN